MPADTITNLQHASTAQAATLQPGYSDAGRSTDIVPATTPTAGPHPIPIILRPWPRNERILVLVGFATHLAGGI